MMYVYLTPSITTSSQNFCPFALDDQLCKQSVEAIKSYSGSQNITGRVQRNLPFSSTPSKFDLHHSRSQELITFTSENFLFIFLAVGIDHYNCSTFLKIIFISNIERSNFEFFETKAQPFLSNTCSYSILLRSDFSKIFITSGG